MLVMPATSGKQAVAIEGEDIVYRTLRGFGVINWAA
jgi:hypothetical protein